MSTPPETTIAAIETGMITRLSLLNSQRQEEQSRRDQEAEQRIDNGEEPLHYLPLFWVRYIEGYGGQLETEEAFNQAMQKAPAIWVTYEGESSILKGENLYRLINMSVIVMCSNYNADQLRAGVGNVPGLYELIEIVREGLTNQNCGVDMTPLQMNSITPLWRGGPEGEGFSMAVLKFSTETVNCCEPDPTVICDEPHIVVDFKLKSIEAISVFKPWEQK
jgi:phage gp37-like protein